MSGLAKRGSAMRKLALVTVLLCAGCNRTAPPAPKVETKAEAEPLKATVWAPKGELYLEYPALVSSTKSRFAIHLTRFSDFRAVSNATCTVELGNDTFACDPSTHPGIFGANVTPRSSGEQVLRIKVTGSGLTETFDVGPVKIAADPASAEKPTELKEETINFSKEQQWALDFGTQVAGEGSLRDSLRVAAETLPRVNGEATVTSPLTGRLNVERTLAPGSPVERGIELASVVPQTNAASELPTLQLDEAQAKVALEAAQRERARAERLVSAGATPARRLDEAKTVEASAQARLNGAQARIAQYEASRSAQGVETGTKRFSIRAPISGIVVDSQAISGSNIEMGKPLYRIVDIESLYVAGVVPESDFDKLRQLSGAEIEMPGGGIRAASKLVSIGRLVDSATRTVPVTYEVDNHDRRLAVNQTVFLRLFFQPGGRAPIIPEEAIVDDAGRPVVFVQLGGETFQRRPVDLGLRANGQVQVLRGLSKGDRVVTKGAYLIRLSTMSSSVPAHGHVH